MTLDEAIKHAEEVAEEKFNNAVSIMDNMKSNIALSNAEECKLCAEEHRQLAEWLGKLQKIEQIINDWEAGRFSDAVGCLRVKEVLEDGSNDC